MSFYLLQIVGKWISLAVLSVASFFGIGSGTKSFEITNDRLSVPAVVETIEYETKKIYNSSLISGTSNVLVEGKDGIAFVNANGETIILEAPITEEIEIGTGRVGSYKGIITAYGPDCKGCSGRGFVACKTVDRKPFNLINDGVYYNDATYGEVRVMAAALAQFPCGTIVKVTNTKTGDFIGIVMDTGGGMKKAFNNGVYHFDVAFTTEKDPAVFKMTNKTGKVQFDVQRWGW